MEENKALKTEQKESTLVAMAKSEAYNEGVSQKSEDPHSVFLKTLIVKREEVEKALKCLMDAQKEYENRHFFDDFIEDKRRISWFGGPAFEVTSQENHKINVLAFYPEEDISDNISTQIHAWKYKGGIRGFICAFSKLIKYGFKFREALEYTKYLASDWDMTDKIIQTNYSNKPFMTIEEYPNENQARIVLCGGHPEYYIWWGGYIEDFQILMKITL